METASLVARRSSLVARRSSLVARRSSLVARRSSLVARRSSLVGGAALLLIARLASADGLTPATQMGLSNPFPPGPNTDYWTVWAKRADGHMVSVSDTQSTPWTQWSDRGNLLGGPGAQGVSATSWVGPGATTEERAYYEVGNIVVEYSLTNRAFAGQRAIPGPAPTKNPTRNFTLTGYFAATHRYTPATGAHQPVVFATIKDNPGDAVAHLWALVISNPGPGQSYDWQQVSTGTTGPISPSWPVVASASGDRTIVRAFARTTHATPHVSMYRWSGAWSSLDLSNPNIASPCGTMAVAEAASVGASPYSIYLFCTGAATRNLYYRHGNAQDGITNTTWTAWATRTVPVGHGNLVNTGYATAAAAREDGVGAPHSIDVFALTDQGQLYQVSHRTGQAALDANPTWLGDDGDFAQREGSLVAGSRNKGHTGGGHSSVFFLGPVTNAGRLYERYGYQFAGTAHPWLNHGNGVGRGTIASSGTHTESSTALHRGKVMEVSIITGWNIPDTVESRWSNDDGDTWGPAVSLPVESDPAHPNTNVVDPVVDFASGGRAYVALFGGDHGDPGGNGPDAADCRRQPTIDHELFFVTTTTGAGPWNPVRLAGPTAPISTCPDDCWNTGVQPPACNLPGCVPDFPPWPVYDHPWVAIYRNPSGPDHVHFVWTVRGINPADGSLTVSVWYAHGSDPYPGNTFPGAGVAQKLIINDTGGDFSPFGGGPIVTVGAGGATYVATNYAICRINDVANAWSGCRGVMQFGAAPDSEVSQSPPNDDLPIPGAVGSNGNPQYVDVGPFRSIIASPTDPNRVYYAYQRREANQTNLDVSFQILTYNPNTDEFTASPAVSLTDVSGDLRDQFQPALTVSRQGTTTDTIFASWYDRRDDALACPVTPNRCYRPMRSVSIDGGLSFIFTQRLPVDGGDTLSDPALLPSRCTASPPPGSNPVPTYRFIGDYRHVSGDPLHSFHVAVGAPLGSGDPTGTLTRGWVSTGFWSW